MNLQSATVRRRTSRHGIEIHTQDPASTESVDTIATALEKRFGASIPPAQLREIAEQAIDHYQAAPIQSYVMILAERLAIDMACEHLPAQRPGPAPTCGACLG